MNTCTQTDVSMAVERLSPKMQAIAWHVADEGAGYDQEDAYQDMALTLMEQEIEQPSFLDQKDAYILNLCSWRTRQKAEAGRVYGKYVEPESAEFELFSDRIAGPEEDVETKELLAGLMEVIDSLPEKDKKIISLLAIDCTPAEISRTLGVTRSAVCQRLQRIRKILAEYIHA